MEIEHPAQRVAIGSIAIVDRKLKPLQRRNVYETARLVPFVALKRRETLSIQGTHRKRPVERHVILRTKIHGGIQSCLHLAFTLIVEFNHLGSIVCQPLQFGLNHIFCIVVIYLAKAIELNLGIGALGTHHVLPGDSTKVDNRSRKRETGNNVVHIIHNTKVKGITVGCTKIHQIIELKRKFCTLNDIIFIHLQLCLAEERCLRLRVALYHPTLAAELDIHLVDKNISVRQAYKILEVDTQTESFENTMGVSYCGCKIVG